MTNILPNMSPEQHKAMDDALKTTLSETRLDQVLQHLAETAAKLVNARYAALGVPDGRGGLAQFLTFGMNDNQMGVMDHLPFGKGLLGALLTSPEIIRLDDLKRDSRSAGFCQNHPHMTSFLGAPIIASGRHLGNLYLCDSVDGEAFTETDEYMVASLADFAAIAILNAERAEQQRKITLFEERDRIAMELHDGIIQSIYAVGMALEIARTSIVNNTNLNNLLVGATKDLDSVIDDLRHYILDLKVGVNHSLELHQQLEDIARKFRSMCGARLEITIPKLVSFVSEDMLHAIVQTVREALSNIARHANAHNASLVLQESTSLLTLSISDDGDGFDPNTVKLGRGLENMRRRIQHLNGSFDITSQPDQGTSLIVTMRL